MFRSFFTTIFRGSSAVLCAITIPPADLRLLSLYYYAVCGRKIYYSIFIWSSTCYGQHTAHHQESKTALAASGLHTWKVVGRVVTGRCQAEPNQRLLVQF